MKNVLKSWLLCMALLAFASAIANAADKKAPASGKVDFTRDIRPILSDSCFHCHGPDESTRKAKMRLDTKEGALAERKGRFPVIPGKPDESEIIKRIFSDDPDEQMPPPDYARQLSAAHKQKIKQWISEGAAWQEHWAFQKPVRAETPRVKN